MASTKEIHSSSKLPGQHRLSINAGSLPRSGHGRHHSHTLSTSLNPSHRVTRRKSVSNNIASATAVAVAREIGETPSSVSASRRHTMSRSVGNKMGMATPPSSLPSHRLSMAARPRIDRDENAIDDDEDLNEDYDEDQIDFEKSGLRRASDATSTKGDGKKLSKDDLRCKKCGKGYKHSSCLTKHLWEHTPEWSYTSKLLISKHQQVQLLEAASVLVAMNTDGTTPPESAKDFQSDQDSTSPAASGSSDPHDGLSSADTTPPPQDNQPTYVENSYGARPKRYSSGNNFSRSYQSAPSGNSLIGSAPNNFGFSQYHKQSSERRPLSSGFTQSGQEDEAGLAAAVELLSCSFGTPRTGPVTLAADVPPVPPLPARYLSQSSFPKAPAQQNPVGSSSSLHRDDHRGGDVKMEEDGESLADDDEYDAHSRGRSDEEDDGVFGRMEE